MASESGEIFLGNPSSGLIPITGRLSQVFTLALAGVAFWHMIVAPGVVGTEFIGTIYIAFTLCLFVLFGVLFVLLRFATAGSTVFWSGNTRPRQNVERIALMIATALTFQISAGWIFDLQGRLDETAGAVGLLTWTIVPAALVVFGIVDWPARMRSASKLRLTLVGGLAVCCAIAVSYAKFANGPPELAIPPVAGLLILIAGVVAAAAAEEVVFRVLLLTALLDLTRSRCHAVFLSGVVFGLIHAPLALMQPAVRGDWPMLQYAAHSYAPIFLCQTGIGLILGVLWLRTGSISLVVLAHAIINVGPTMLTRF